ncbi:basic secretory protein-like protein [Allorhodopirellula solitaria]|uniref:Plant Basic Secretory Protein n=1 Tax=Allorhodopirellula solitaria TaxID=2527987 RepID=A0A5C5XR49_9BACT|nr:basic secretory protein-like protein [Allorhodopirellula solitaria]TWT64833.1 Plant Basic Secretory Protein [Allorhodopirellula solitaria]
MLNRTPLLLALAASLHAPTSLWAEATVSVGHQSERRADARFQIPEMESPVQGDAGEEGTWAVVSGTPDRAGGGLTKLNDGQLPRLSDQPSENFFFAPATDGGRLLLDLERSIELAEIRSYSWHPSERSPQVYTVYGCDPPAEDQRERQIDNDGSFQLKPAAETDPESCGWTKIASINTRGPKVDRRLRPSDNSKVDRRLRPSERNNADRRLRPSERNNVDRRLRPSRENTASQPLRPATVGGQVGVKIANNDEDSRSPLGRFRYLLFEIQPAEPGARFSNTFFSEIDVLEKGAAVTPAHSIDVEGIATFEIESGEYEFVMDTSDCSDLTRWAEQELAPVVQQWYPKVVELLASDGYEAPQSFRIHISSAMDGVAATSGTNVTCSADWYRRNLQGEAKGATVHELVHVVQQYGNARRTNPQAKRTPGWVVEGIADYVRWHLYEPESVGGGVARRRPSSLRYDASYRDTAAFLAWVIDEGNPDLLAQLNAAARTGTYTDAFWRKTTGSTAQQLSDAWHAELDPKPAAQD